MTINNKEAIDKLESYYAEQDPRTVARALAALMLDIHRIVTVDRLPEGEAINLKNRMVLNSQAFVDFIKNGSKGEKFKIINIPSGEGGSE